jgi:hypothetical protein
MTTHSLSSDVHDGRDRAVCGYHLLPMRHDGFEWATIDDARDLRGGARESACVRIGSS